MIDRIGNKQAHTELRGHTKASNTGGDGIIGSKCPRWALNHASPALIVGKIVRHPWALSHTFPGGVIGIITPMVAALHTFSCQCISVIVGRTILYASFVYILGESTNGACFEAVPCRIISIIAIRTLVLALLGNIVSKLLTGAVAHTG